MWTQDDMDNERGHLNNQFVIAISIINWRMGGGVGWLAEWLAIHCRLIIQQGRRGQERTSHKSLCKIKGRLTPTMREWVN